MKIETIIPSQIPLDWYGEIIGFDIETEDKKINSPICMVSIWKYNAPVIYVIPIKVYRNGVLEIISQEELDILKDFISKSRVAGHNLQFDLSLVKYQWGVYPADIYMDTFLVARILQLEKQGLKDIVLRIKPELSSVVVKFKDLEGLKPPFIYNIDDTRLVQYSGLDAYFPFIVIKGLARQIKNNERVIKLEMEMLKTCIDQNVNGLLFDLELFNKKVEEFSSKVAEENEELDKLVGWHVRCNATADKKKLLIDYYGCEPTLLTKKGAPSMSSEALEQMAENDNREEVVDRINRILSINENFSKYNGVKKVPEFIFNNKLHFELEQIGYDGTARLYSKDFAVNMLNWDMRESVVAPKGKKFLFFDWKAAELFIVLNWSGCKKGIDWYNSGIDLHREVMKGLLGKEDITKEERNQSKVLSFSQIYGGSAYTIKKDLNCSIEYAEKLYEDYQAFFPEIVNLRNETILFAHSNGYTEDIIGRKRKLQNINSDWQVEREKDERRAYNTKIQSSCASLLKTACVRCRKEFPEVRVAFTVFDSFLIEVPEDYTEEQCVKIMDRMSDFTDIQPGLKIRYDYGIGHNWQEAHDNAE